MSNCFFHELSDVKKSGPTFFVVIFYVICLTVNNLSGFLDTTDTPFMQPCVAMQPKFNMGLFVVDGFIFGGFSNLWDHSYS